MDDGAVLDSSTDVFSPPPADVAVVSTAEIESEMVIVASVFWIAASIDADATADAEFELPDSVAVEATELDCVMLVLEELAVVFVLILVLVSERVEEAALLFVVFAARSSCNLIVFVCSDVDVVSGSCLFGEPPACKSP